MKTSSAAHGSDPDLVTTDDVVLTIKGLSVTFGGVHAVDDVALTLRIGQTVAVIGPNGAGKTTLLNAICRLVPTRGELVIDGRSAGRMRPADVARCGVARSFQDPPLLDDQTVLENVLLGAHRLLGYSMVDQVLRRGKVRRLEEEHEERARLLIDLVGLSHAIDRTAGSLPFGSRKLLDIARAVVSSPRVLLLDEPSSGIDRVEREIVASILKELQQHERLAILVVEHHMDLVRAIATHVFALQGGRPFMHGTPTEVLDSAAFRDSLVGGSHAPARAERVDGTRASGGS